MKIGRIMGVFLSMLSVMGLINQSIYADEQARNTSFGLAYANESTSYNLNNQFDSNNRSNVEIITYTNNYNHDVNLTGSNVVISCYGNNHDDELLVKNNFDINALFSEKKNGSKTNSIQVKKGQKVYIYVISEYIGEKYPTSEVMCEYSINLNVV